MTIKIGDAVMTPGGRHGLVVKIDYAKSVTVAEIILHDGMMVRVATKHRRDELTPLIPDTGLEERVRSLCLWEPHTSSQHVLGTYQDGWAHGYREAMNRVLALLDTPEAEPEPRPGPWGAAGFP